MTDDEIITVVKAHKEGKRVQFKYKPTEDSDYEWFDVDHTQIWFFDKYEYRVAPEPRKPREWVCFVDKNGVLREYEHAMTLQELNNPDTVRVREVIE